MGRRQFPHVVIRLDQRILNLVFSGIIHCRKGLDRKSARCNSLLQGSELGIGRDRGLIGDMSDSGRGDLASDSFSHDLGDCGSDVRAGGDGGEEARTGGSPE